ncbi:hypothetical protein LINGRAHAP2_LOCUS7474, partial [Linum grandiflorum]
SKQQRQPLSLAEGRVRQQLRRAIGEEIGEEEALSIGVARHKGSGLEARRRPEEERRGRKLVVAAATICEGARHAGGGGGVVVVRQPYSTFETKFDARKRCRMTKVRFGAIGVDLGQAMSISGCFQEVWSRRSLAGVWRLKMTTSVSSLE